MAYGLSWTIDIGMTRRFAKFYAEPYFGGEGVVIGAEVPKAAVPAYFNGRIEQEVVADGRRARRLREIESCPPRQSGGRLCGGAGSPSGGTRNVA
jgi:hypothetical protein